MFFFGHTQRYCYGDADVYHFVFCLSSQSLDLTSKRMIHEGPLTWKVNKDKTLGKTHNTPQIASVGYSVQS